MSREVDQDSDEVGAVLGIAIEVLLSIQTGEMSDSKTLHKRSSERLTGHGCLLALREFEPAAELASLYHKP